MFRPTKIAGLLLLALSTELRASDRTPATLLDALPSTVNQDVVLVDGSITNRPGVKGWEIFVNDSQTLEVKVQQGTTTDVRFAIQLRPGDNLLSIQETSDAEPVRHWERHICRESNIKPRQYALLLRGYDPDPKYIDSQLSQLQQRLVQNGLPKEHIAIANSVSSLRGVLPKLSEGSERADRLLVYFVGHTEPRASGEPSLKLSLDSSGPGTIRLSNVLFDVVETGWHGTLSAVVDSDTTPSSDPTEQSKTDGRIPALAVSDSMSSPWMQAIVPQPVGELLVSNSSRSHTPGYLLSGLFDQLEHFESASDCVTIEDLFSRTNTRDKSETLDASYLRDPSTAQFCLKSESTSELDKLVKLTITSDADQSKAVIKCDLDSRFPARWLNISADGVLLRHRSLNIDQTTALPTVTEVLSLSHGIHYVDVWFGKGSAVYYRKTERVVLPGANHSGSESSSRLIARFRSPESAASSTNADYSNIEFIVGDLDRTNTFVELRNNGVRLFSGELRKLHHRETIDIVKRVPLTIGSNTLTVSVYRDNFSASSTVNIVRRAEDSVKALVIGTGTHSQIQQIDGGAQDAVAFRDLLLRYTDADSDDITLLTGQRATREAIYDALSESTARTTYETTLKGEEDTPTLVLFFAGLGATVDSPDGGSARCMLQYEADPANLIDTCVKTSDLDKLLSNWDAALIVVDTSYDGIAGIQPPRSGNSLRLVSRTFRDSFSSDNGWRLRSGLINTNQLFLVASGTNSPALEDPVVGHGVFTHSLIAAVQSQFNETAEADQHSNVLSASDAYLLTRNDVVRKTANLQIPVSKGVLSTPFYFKRISADDLLIEADVLTSKAERDGDAMRTPDPSELKRAKRLYRKVEDLDSSRNEAIVGMARLSVLEGDENLASKLIDSALNSNSQANRGEWLLLSSRLSLREGNLDAAVLAARSSCQTKPVNLRCLLFLSRLYAAERKYDEAFDVAQEVLEGFMNPDLSERQSLSEEEWGRTIIWIYLIEHLADRRGNSKEMLHSYSLQHARGFGALENALIKHSPLTAFSSTRSRAYHYGHVDVYDRWSQLVARYLLHPTHFESELDRFRVISMDEDEKKLEAFNCHLHFYKGLQFFIAHDRTAAFREFSLAVESKQTKYPEFWVANSMLDNLAHE